MRRPRPVSSCLVCLALASTEAFIPTRDHRRPAREAAEFPRPPPEHERHLAASAPKEIQEHATNYLHNLKASATQVWCAVALAMSVAFLPAPAMAVASSQQLPQQTSRIYTRTDNINNKSGGDDADIDDEDKPPQPKKSRYYTIQRSGTREEIMAANEALMDHAVGIISTIYYDKTAGAYFTPRDLHDKWRALRVYAKGGDEALTKLKEQDSTRGEDRMTWMRGPDYRASPMPEDVLGSRENVVKGLKWVVSTLDDPYSAYKTREELWDEKHKRADGFLGTGAFVETPRHISPTTSWFHSTGSDPQIDRSMLHKTRANGKGASSQIISRTRADNLPIVSAIVPNSPAERAGIAVGDRIIAVGSDKFVGNRERIENKLRKRYSSSNYIGYPDLTIAKPVLATTSLDTDMARESITGYRKIRVSLPTSLVEPYHPYSSQSQMSIAGGDSIVN